MLNIYVWRPRLPNRSIRASTAYSSFWEHMRDVAVWVHVVLLVPAAVLHAQVVHVVADVKLNVQL